MIVAPDRDTPGTRAKSWKSPTLKAELGRISPISILVGAGRRLSIRRIAMQSRTGLTETAQEKRTAPT